MNQQLKDLILGAGRLSRVVEYSFKIQPIYFLVVTLLRTTIKLLYFSSSILPFKILLVLSTEYSIPSFLEPYFSNKASFAYTLCLVIGVALIMAKVLEIGTEKIARLKTKAVLGEKYSSKPKRRKILNNYIFKATEVASCWIIIGFSIVLLFVIEYQIAIVVIIVSVACLFIAIISSGKLNRYIEYSPMKYMDNCLTGISLLSFFSLVYISINSTVPQPFLYLLISLILIRQYTQSVNQVVSVGLFLKNKDASIERVFKKL